MKSIYTGSFLAVALTGFGTALQAQPAVQADQDVQAQQTGQASQSVIADEISGPMVVRQATGLDGTEVLLENGESIGEIDEIVHSNIDGEFYGVLDVSGILGIGENELIVALEDLEYDADEERLYLPSGQNVEELAEFDEELYSEIDNETTVQIRPRAGADLR